MTATAAIKILSDFAIARLDSVSLDEQMRIYNALSSVAPTFNERMVAHNMVKALSKAAALQLEFRIASGVKRRRNHHKGGDGEHKKGDGK